MLLFTGVSRLRLCNEERELNGVFPAKRERDSPAGRKVRVHGIICCPALFAAQQCNVPYSWSELERYRNVDFRPSQLTHSCDNLSWKKMVFKVFLNVNKLKIPFQYHESHLTYANDTSYSIDKRKECNITVNWQR